MNEYNKIFSYKYKVEQIKVKGLTGKLMGKRIEWIQQEVEKIKVKGLKEIHS